MSGGAETPDLGEYKDETGLVKEVMELFNVDKETAERIVTWSGTLARCMFDKWQNNYIRRISERLRKEEEEFRIKMGLSSIFEEGR